MLGKTFTPRALAASRAVERAELEPLLGGLVRKEVLGLQSDPRSPEHGQYGFLQDLLRQVAYETLPTEERRPKHLPAAEHLSGALTEEEVAEVVASHLLGGVSDRARCSRLGAADDEGSACLVHAGERAASLGAAAEARRYFEHRGPGRRRAEQASTLCRAGEMAMLEARRGGRTTVRAVD